MNSDLKSQDIEIFNSIQSELDRQTNTLELIASENFTSKSVMEAVGSVLTNKYAEGYPGKRYYGGCEEVDVVENIARDRGKKLFGADYANVQPHSGSQANMGVYLTFLEHGDKVMGLIKAGVKSGGEAVTGGSMIDGPGYYVEPTVLINPPQASQVVQEEIFGPVITAIPFDDLEEAAGLANDTTYGLSSYVWSQNIQKVHQLVPKIRAGQVYVNSSCLLYTSDAADE